MIKSKWLVVCFAIWLTTATAQSGRAHCNFTTGFYQAVSAKLAAEALNCTEFIPGDWRDVMRENEPPDERSGGHMLAKYVLECLQHEMLRAKVRKSSPFSLVPSPQILYDAMLNQVVSLGFDGTLVTKVIILLEWTDPRIQWNNATGIGNWTFPAEVYYPIKDVWVPNFRLANCQTTSCLVKPKETTELSVANKGSILFEAEVALRSTCDLDLTWFPLDEQNCTLEFIETDILICNLLIPMLLVAFTGIASVFIPTTTESKLNLPITVVLTFIFLQALVASMSPKTHTSPFVAKYILWSLVLAAFNVCCCAVVWMLFSMADKSKPWRVLHVLLVHCTGRKFWVQLLRRCRRRFHKFRAAPDDTAIQLDKCGHSRNKRIECVRQSSSQVPPESGHVAGENKKEVDGVDVPGDKTPEPSEEDPNSWKAVALGLNRVNTLAYLLGNAIVFALFLGPLLHRIFMYSIHNDGSSYSFALDI